MTQDPSCSKPIKASDSDSIYYDALDLFMGDHDSETPRPRTSVDTITSANTAMPTIKTSAPLTTTPVRPVVDDPTIASEIQEKKKAGGDLSKGSSGDKRGRSTSVKRYELVDEGPVVNVHQNYADDTDEERGGGGGREYDEVKVMQHPQASDSPESEGWLPAVDEALPRSHAPSGKNKNKDVVGKTRSASRREETRDRKTGSLSVARRESLYNHDDSGYDQPRGRERNWGEPSESAAKRSGSMRSIGTTGTTLTTDDGRVVRASAFLPNGAGTVGPGSRVRVEGELQDKHKKSTKRGFGWALGLGGGKNDKIERELEKVVMAEGKTERGALKDAVKELDGLTRVQKDAVKNEARAQAKLVSLLSTLHKSELAYLHARGQHETMVAAVRAQEGVIGKVREGAMEATDRVREKAGEISALRGVLERDENERIKS